MPNCGIQENPSEENGRLVKVPKLKSKSKNLRELSFQVHGAQLFNPQEIRNMKKV